jgi:hypothetical protein
LLGFFEVVLLGHCILELYEVWIDKKGCFQIEYDYIEKEATVGGFLDGRD